MLGGIFAFSEEG
uniref:Uncharacterized protein n=2 Tax=Mesangiospermae TaxID=1437183 RepID=F6I2R4_VITVI